MSSDSSDLSAASQSLIQYLTQASRHQRDTFTKDAEFQYEQYIDCRLLESTYTKTEAVDALHGLFLIMQSAMHEEREQLTQSYSAVLAHVLREAERQGARIRLTPDELAMHLSSNVHGGSAAADLTMTPSLQTAGSRARLTPIGGVTATAPATPSAPAEGSTAAAAEAQLALLNDKIQCVTDMYAASKREQALLQQENARLREATEASTQGGNAAAQHQSRLSNEISELRRELATRLSSSAQFTNMKRMMQEKNEALKGLRQRLSKYEPLQDDDDDAGDIVR